MAKKKKRKYKKKVESTSLFDGLREETIHGVWAVVFFVLAIFSILSSFGLSGVVGEYFYNFFRYLLGVGYFLFPILLIMIAMSFVGSLKNNLGKSRLFGSLLFFISGLGIIDLIFTSEGGLIGHYISTPLVLLFDKATIVFLIALILISILVMFDMRVSFDPIKNLFGKFKKEKGDGEDEYEEDEFDYEGGDEEDEFIEEEETEEDDDEEYEVEYKKPRGIKKLFGKGSDDTIDEESSEFRFSPAQGIEYTPPPLTLLEKDKGKPDVGDVKANANIIKRTFYNFGIQVEMDEVSIGPTVTRYALKPAEGVRLSKILSLQNNLELALAAHPVRIEAPIPGRALVGIEVPNSTKSMIGLASLLSEPEYQNSDKPLLIGLGKDIAGQAIFANLAKMPHALIAGATGAGKSVTIHDVINSLLFRNSPQQLRLLMVDPKRVELTLYKDIPHLLAPVITDAKKAILALKWAAKEMDRRYDLLESESVRDIESYHKNVLAPAIKKMERKGGDANEEDAPETMPYIVIIIDELADIMQAYPRELESAIVRLAQMSRAVGIHLILSTQRPSVNIITGLIKANIPARIALQVASQIDSRTILDMSGAEKLLGAGDMLYLSADMSKPKRIQAPFISETEVKDVVKFLKKSYEDELPDIIDFTAENSSDAIFSSSLEDDDEDDLYEVAKETVIDAGKASTSYLQRKLRVGYSRAARLIDILEDRGVVGPADGSKPREIILEDTKINDGDDDYDENENDEHDDYDENDEESEDEDNKI